ncbi:right-handed parallel beta-helix repeat-containing protein [Asanoa siamensis]|nr:right-handed parallel beta-helix repeat-containing protein [Asanoa siamensis]
MRTARRLALLCAGLSLTAGLSVVTASTAAAAEPGTLFVSTSCGDGSDVYCSISDAVERVRPGQTIEIDRGTFAETVVVPSGEPGKPIRFVGYRGDGHRTVVESPAGPAFLISGAHDVVIEGIDAWSGKDGAPAVVAENSTDITVSGGRVVAIGAPGVEISGGSRRVTVSGMVATGATAPLFAVGGGASDTLLAANSVWAGRAAGYPQTTAVTVADAPRTTIVNSTIVTDCQVGVAVTGASAGFALYNSIVRTTGLVRPGQCQVQPGPDPASVTPVTVDGAASTDGRLDYNVIDPGHGGPLYGWGGVAFPTPAALATATGQGTHDIGADPKLTTTNPQWAGWALAADSPAVDSALATAPRMLATDLRGNAHADKPDTANAGGGYVDRGAVEVVPTPTVTTTFTNAPGGGAFETVTTATRTYPWATDGPIGTFQFRGDWQSPFFDRTGTARITFDRPGNLCVYVRLSLDGFRTNTAVHTERPCLLLAAAYQAVTPVRVLDTRTRLGAVPVGPGDTVFVDVPSGGAAVLNVTATQPTTSGFLKIYSSADPEPEASNLNFAAGQTIANLVTVKSLNHTPVAIRNGGRGTVHVLADLVGYYGDAGHGLETTAPARVLDTRAAVGVPGTAPVAANGRVTVDLSARVPAGTTAAVLNLTATSPTKGGLFTAYPPGADVPTASSLNFVAGQTVNNMVIAPVVDGKIAFAHTGSGTVHLIADLSGWFAPGAHQFFLPSQPTRILDTRGTPVGPGQTVRVPISRAACPTQGCPAPAAVVANVTATNAARSGYLSVYPYGQPRPTQSVLNFASGQTVATLATVGVDEDSFLVYNGGKGTVDVIVDQAGLYIGTGN